MSEPSDRPPDFESGGLHEVDLSEVPTELSVLPLRDTILFPNAILPLAVARESSVALVHDAVRERKVIGRLLGDGAKVLATGGGAYMNGETRSRIKEDGVSVWLRADLPLLMKRVSKRPGYEIYY